VEFGKICRRKLWSLIISYICSVKVISVCYVLKFVAGDMTCVVYLITVLLLVLQALSHRTLVMLMGDDDPAKSQTEVISAAEPHVAFAYLKHLWHSDKKVIGFALSRFILIFSQSYCCTQCDWLLA